MPKMVLCFKAARGAAVAFERLDRLVQRSLHLRMELFIFQLFTSNPLRSGDQRGLFFEVLYVPIAGVVLRAILRCL